MTLHDFLKNKNDNIIKITSEELTVNNIIKAFNAIEVKNDKVSQIKMNSKKFELLITKIKADVYEGQNLYRTIKKEKQLFKADIIIDENIPNEIIILIGTKNNHQNICQMFTP